MSYAPTNPAIDPQESLRLRGRLLSLISTNQAYPISQDAFAVATNRIPASPALVARVILREFQERPRAFHKPRTGELRGFRHPPPPGPCKENRAVNQRRAHASIGQVHDSKLPPTRQA